MAPVPDFLEYVNNQLGLAFTGSWNDVSVSFLDITLTDDLSSAVVVTSLYRKDMADNMLLWADSCHPRHTIMVVPKGEYIRAKRACTKVQDFECETKIIDYRLIKRVILNGCLVKLKFR